MPWTPPKRYILQRILLVIVLAVLTLAVVSPVRGKSAAAEQNLTAEPARSSRSVLHKHSHGAVDTDRNQTNVGATTRSSSPDFERIETNRQEMDEESNAGDSEDEYEDEGDLDNLEKGETEKTTGRTKTKQSAALAVKKEEVHVEKQMHTRKPIPESKLQAESRPPSPSPNPTTSKAGSDFRITGNGHEKWLGALRELFIKFGYKPEKVPKLVGPAPASGSSATVSAKIKSPELRMILQGLVGRLPPDFAKYVVDVLQNENAEEASKSISSTRTRAPAISPMELNHIIDELEASWRRHYGKQMEARDLNRTLAGLQREWEKKHGQGHKINPNSTTTGSGADAQEMRDSIRSPSQGQEASQKSSDFKPNNIEDEEKQELKKAIQELEVFGKTEAQKLNWEEQERKILEMVDDLKDLSSGTAHVSHVDPTHAQQLATILADLRRASNLKLERQHEREGTATASKDEDLTTKILHALNAEVDARQKQQTSVLGRSQNLQKLDDMNSGMEADNKAMQVENTLDGRGSPLLPDIEGSFNRLQAAVDEDHEREANAASQNQNYYPHTQRQESVGAAAADVDSAEQLKHMLAETPADGGRQPARPLPKITFPRRKAKNLRPASTATADDEYLKKVRNFEAQAVAASKKV